MSYFKRIALIKAQQKLEPPNHTYSSDLTEICSLAACIEKAVSLVAIPVSPYDRSPFRKFAGSLKRHRFGLVGLSAMTGGYNSAREYARIAREAGAYVVMGGYHPTAMPAEVLADPNVDAVVRGEGERTLSELVLHGPGRDVRGLSFKDRHGEIVHNPDRELIHDLDSLPLPLREIRPARFGEKGRDYSIDTLYSSRGCIARCTFCANDTVNKNLRTRSPENFIEELKQIHGRRVKKIVKFWDSIFLFDPARVEKIVELMFRNGLTNFRIVTESRSDDVIRCAHLLKDMKRLGFEKIQIGIESPDPETFRRLRKGGSVAKHEQAVRLVQKARMKVEGFFIIGHPDETGDRIRKYPEFATRMGIGERALYFVMTPYPGTRVYREYREKKLIDSYDWDCYNNYGTVIHLPRLSRGQVRCLLAHCYGATGGISYAFRKQNSLIAIIGQLLGQSVVGLYFHDLQGVRDAGSRARFGAAFFAAGLGSYRRKRKINYFGRLFQRFCRKVEFQIDLGPGNVFAFGFHLAGEDLSLEVRRAEKVNPYKVSVTMEDLDVLRLRVDMVDCNAWMVLTQKNAGIVHRGWQLARCWPTLWRTGSALVRLTLTLGRRYLITRLNPAPIGSLWEQENPSFK